MGITDIEFIGLIGNRPLATVTGPEFINALKKSGWREGTGTHFFQQLRKDGPTRGIHTLNDLVRAIRQGESVPGRDGKTLHWICGGAAYVVYNQETKTLITLSQGNQV